MQPKKPSDSPVKKAPEDDRNLVVVDKDFADADVEDRVWLFWKRNRGAIILAIVLVCAVVLGNTLYKNWRASSVAGMQDAYLAAQTPEALAAFAAEYAKEPLGAVAAVQVADMDYLEGRFEQAAEKYAAAIPVLTVPEQAQRARMGEAVSLLRAGKDPNGEKLVQIARDGTVSDAVRGQAAYQLALKAAVAADYATARSWLEQIASLPYAGPWMERAQMLAALKPEILKPDAKTAAEAPQTKP